MSTKAERVGNAVIHYVSDFSFLRKFFDDQGCWRGCPYSAVDIETEGVLFPYDGEIATVQIELRGECYVVHWSSALTLPQVEGAELFRAYLESTQVTKIIHNATFELMWFLKAFGWGLRPERIHDTMAGDYILAEGAGVDEDNPFAKPKLTLDALVQRRYGVEMDKDLALRTGFRRKGKVDVVPPAKLGGVPQCQHPGCSYTAVWSVGSKSVPLCDLCVGHKDYSRLKKRERINGADYVATLKEHGDLSERQLRYAAFDALWCAVLAEDQIEEMSYKDVVEGENYLYLLDMDSKATEAIARMQLRGIPVNIEKLMCLDAEWQYREQRLREDIEDAVCFTNILPKLTEPQFQVVHHKTTGTVTVRAPYATGESPTVEYREVPSHDETVRTNPGSENITEDELPVRLGYWKQPSPAAYAKAREAGLKKGDPGWPEAKFVEAVDIPKISSQEQMVPRLQALGINVPSYEGPELKHYKEDPLVKNILEWKAISKLQSTYSNGFLERVHPVTRHVHGSFNQYLTSTGRFSSSNPNLQNLPSKSKDGLDMRACVEAEAGRKLVIADYSQLELRLIAEMFFDLAMREAFNKGLDLHSLFAAKMLGVSYEEMEAGKEGAFKTKRAQAKPANFGLGYGAGVDQFMDIAWSQYGILLTREEATQIRAMWLEMYQGVGAYHNRMKQMIKNGTGPIRVKTQAGRVRRMQREWVNKQGERKTAYAAALNHPVQGTGADGVKIAMNRLIRELPEDAYLILQVHDELVVDCREEDAELCKHLMERAMIESMQPFLTTVPCLVDAKISQCWTK